MEHSGHLKGLGESTVVFKEEPKKEYTKPELTLHGDLKTVTGLISAS